MPIDTQHMDPRCQRCQERDYANCTQFGTVFLLRAPYTPWPGGGPLKCPKTPPPWGQLKWMKE